MSQIPDQHEHQRAAHDKVLRWSHVLSHQVERLHAAREEALRLNRARRAHGTLHTVRDNWPFYRLDGEKHFTLVAARQLVRALNAFDGDDRLPSSVPEQELRQVRNALEHWDEPAGPAGTFLAKKGADADSHQWSASGPGMLGDLVSDAALEEWAHAVYDELVVWDPW